MHSFLIESALLTHGLVSISNEEMLRRWPQELDNIAWVDAGRVVDRLHGGVSPLPGPRVGAVPHQL